MKNKKLVERPKNIRGSWTANSCMVGIGFLFSFSNKLENIRN